MKPLPIQWVTSTFTTADSNQVVNIMASCGGISFSGQGPFTHIPNSCRFDFDNPSEHSQRAALHRELKTEPFGMGENHTMATLFQNSSHPAAADSMLVSNMDATIGLGASPAAGYRAAELMVESDDFQDVLQRLRDFPIIKTNGRLVRLRYFHFISIAGGTGSGSMPIVKAVEESLAPLGVPLDIHVFAIGAITFTGIAPLATLNAPGVLAHWAAYAITRSPFQNVCRSLHLTEYPTFGEDDATRSRIMGVDLQALTARSVQAFTQRIAPNNSSASKFGSIEYREISVIQQKESIAAIQASCAEQCLRKLLPHIEPPQADTSLIVETRWIDNSEKVVRQSIDQIASNKDSDAQMMIDLASRPGATYRFGIQLHMGKYGRFDLSKIDHFFATDLSTEDDLRSRPLLLATFEKFIASEISEIEYQNAFLHSETLSLEKNVVRSLYARSHAWTENGKENANNDLREYLEIIRAKSDSIYENEDKLNVLNVAKQLTTKEIANLQEQLSGIQRCLSNVIATVGPQRSNELVVSNDLTACLPTLLRLQKLVFNRQCENVYRLAYLVTLEGLQLIVGSSAPRIDPIAETIVYGQATFTSPPLGARHRSDQPRNVYVLPTLEAEDGVLLRNAILKRDPRSLVFFTDAINEGAAVLRIRFRGFSNVESLFPGILRSDLLRALKSKTPMLRFPHGMDCLEQLGIRVDIKNDTVHFDDRV